MVALLGELSYALIMMTRQTNIDQDGKIVTVLTQLDESEGWTVEAIDELHAQEVRMASLPKADRERAQLEFTEIDPEPENAAATIESIVDRIERAQ